MLKTPELIKELAVNTELSWVSVKRLLNTLSEIVYRELKAWEKIVLPWLATLSTVEVASRTGRNPKTWEALQINAYTKVKFKALKVLKDSLK